ncbi:S-layer homology domain-containing protein [Phormidium sp. CCY1219]|nr:S-layer homology domain-containing protein [Phormidium sp. CCY1219]
MNFWHKLPTIFRGSTHPTVARGQAVSLPGGREAAKSPPRVPLSVLILAGGTLFWVSLPFPVWAQVVFSDIQNHWARSCIEDLAARDILTVFSEENFRPEDPVQRVEYAAVIGRAFPDSEQVRDGIEFVDIPTDYWARDIIEAAYTRGFISSYSGRIFNPTKELPRWQALALLSRGLKYESPSDPMAILEASLADWDGIPDFARNAIAAGVNQGLVVNYPDRRILNPTEPVSRGELAAFLCQAIASSQPVALIPQEYVAIAQQPAIASTPAEELSSPSPTPEETATAQELDTPEETAGAQELDTPEETAGAQELDIPEETAGAQELDTPEETAGAQELDIPDEIATPEEMPIAAANSQWQNAVLTSILNFQPSGIDRDSTIEKCVSDGEGNRSCEPVKASRDAVSLAIGPEGSVMASGHLGPDNGQINLWSLRSGELIRTLPGHSTRVGALAIAPDGKTLVSGGGDATLKIWDLRTGELKNTLTEHGDEITSVAIAPDGNTLISSSRDRTIIFWNLNTGESTLTINSHGSSILGLTLSPDGQLVASSSDDGLVKIWRVDNGALVRTISADINPVNALAISPDNQTLATGSEGSVRLWDIATGDLLRTLARDPAASFVDLTFTRDGENLVSSGKEGDEEAIGVWNVRTGALLHVFPTFAQAIAFTPDGQTLVAGGWDIKIWEVSQQ